MNILHGDNRAIASVFSTLGRRLVQAALVALLVGTLCFS